MLSVASEPLPWTGNDYIDGILWGGNHWSLGSDRVIEYSFLDEDTDPAYYSWFDDEIVSVEAALQTWSNVANIEFIRVADNDPDATLRFAAVYTYYDYGVIGVGYPPDPEYSNAGLAGLVLLAWDSPNWFNSREPGGRGFATILHEVGHALGLAHPHDNGGGSDIYPGVPDNDPYSIGEFGLNQGVWTTMTYNRGLVSNNLGIDSPYGFQATPMAFDVAAIQYLYGANTSFQAHDNVYELPSSNSLGTSYSCIWDTGGQDTISASGAISGVTIDLRPAPLTGENAGGYISSVDGIYGGFTIANGVTIENAVGGIGDDFIVGNDANNNLTGSMGDDILIGVDESNVQPGFAEIDLLWGGVGNDEFILGNNDQSYYSDLGNDDFAWIIDFNFIEDDTIALYGIDTDYTFDNVTFDGYSGAGIYYHDSESGDLIGFIEGVDEYDLNLATDFTWLGQDLLNSPIFRFQNSNIPGTYLFAGEEESQSIRDNFPSFIEEGFAFEVASIPGDDLIQINRFQNSNIPGTYLFAEEEESQSIRDNFPNFIEEGIAFYVYGAAANRGEDIYRFQNSNVPGTYIFVAEQERQSILANHPNFIEEGIAFEVDL